MIRIVPVILCLACGLMAIAPRVQAGDGAALVETLAELEPYLGIWQIEASWSDGSTLWAQAEYSPMLGGRFIDGRVWVRENGGELYQRYRTIFAPTELVGRVDLHTFNRDGSHVLIAMQVDGAVATTEWDAADMRIAERMEVAGDTLRWQVWKVDGDGGHELLLNGLWHKVAVDPVATVQATALAEDLAPFAPWLGGWETSASLGEGGPRWSRAEYEPGLGGRFVDSRTWATDEDGAWQQRSATVFHGGAAGDGVRMVRFSADGKVSEGRVIVALDPGGARELVMTGDAGRTTGLEQRMVMESASSYRVQVMDGEEDGGSRIQVLDASWRRQGQPRGEIAAIVDPERFADRGMDLRSFTKERVIEAPLAAVWAAWTSAEAWQRLWGPGARARFELAVGGRYEWLFDGAIGGNGCQILSYVPERMVSFSWNAPPSQPDTRLQKTWVVVETEAMDAGTTRVRLTHLGFGGGPAWDETFAYFERAWDRVLDLMATRLPGADSVARPGKTQSSE